MSQIKGRWGTIPWYFIPSSELPKTTLCTATFAIVTHQNQLLLIRHTLTSRGWELPGGHIEPFESPLESITREVLEEGKTIITQPKLFGYKKVSPSHPIPHRSHGGTFYPFPHSYILYYHATAQYILSENQLSHDVTEARFVTLSEAEKLLNSTQHHNLIVRHLIETNQISLRP